MTKFQYMLASFEHFHKLSKNLGKQTVLDLFIRGGRGVADLQLGLTI